MRHVDELIHSLIRHGVDIGGAVIVGIGRIGHDGKAQSLPFPGVLLRCGSKLFYSCLDCTLGAVGAGKLGRALLDYDGFEDFGVRIIAGFDRNEQAIRLGNTSKEILPISARLIANVASYRFKEEAIGTLRDRMAAVLEETQ